VKLNKKLLQTLFSIILFSIFSNQIHAYGPFDWLNRFGWGNQSTKTTIIKTAQETSKNNLFKKLTLKNDTPKQLIEKSSSWFSKKYLIGAGLIATAGICWYLWKWWNGPQKSFKETANKKESKSKPEKQQSTREEESSQLKKYLQELYNSCVKESIDNFKEVSETLVSSSKGKIKEEELQEIQSLTLSGKWKEAAEKVITLASNYGIELNSLDEKVVAKPKIPGEERSNNNSESAESTSSKKKNENDLLSSVKENTLKSALQSLYNNYSEGYIIEPDGRTFTIIRSSILGFSDISEKRLTQIFNDMCDLANNKQWETAIEKVEELAQELNISLEKNNKKSSSIEERMRKLHFSKTGKKESVQKKQQEILMNKTADSQKELSKRDHEGIKRTALIKNIVEIKKKNFKSYLQFLYNKCSRKEILNLDHPFFKKLKEFAFVDSKIIDEFINEILNLINNKKWKTAKIKIVQLAERCKITLETEKKVRINLAQNIILN